MFNIILKYVFTASHKGIALMHFKLIAEVIQSVVDLRTIQNIRPLPDRGYSKMLFFNFESSLQYWNMSIGGCNINFVRSRNLRVYLYRL